MTRETAIAQARAEQYAASVVSMLPTLLAPPRYGWLDRWVCRRRDRRLRSLLALPASTPTDQDAYVRAALRWVRSSIALDERPDAYWPEVTLDAMAGNCVAGSVLLASIIRSRLDPAGRLRVVVGLHHGVGPSTRHCWLTWDGLILDWLADSQPRPADHCRYTAQGEAVVQ